MFYPRKSITKGLVCAVAILFCAITVSRGQNQSSRNGNDPTNASFVRGRLLVKFKSGIGKAQAQYIINSESSYDAGPIPGTDVHIIELPEQASEEALEHAFKGHKEVQFAELDRILPPEDIYPNDPGFVNQGYLTRINAPAAWELNSGSPDVVIAILDTGVDGTHEDLAPHMVSGWNVYSNNSDTRDVYGHGTLVAGTAAAAGNNGLGVASVAYNCRIMPIRISDASGSATYSSMASGLAWAANNGARIANISYMASGSSTVSSAARNFRNKGGIVTVAAGNYGTFDSTANNPDVLTVSATDPDDALYSWSNTGNNIDIAAPGYIYATANGGGYASAMGTSGSAPVVAGVAALVISTNPRLTSSQVEDILKQSADDLGPMGWDSTYGFGRVNAGSAVAMAMSGTTPADSVAPSVNINYPGPGATVADTVTVQIGATDNVGVSSVTLKVDGIALASDSSSPYEFSWNTTGLVNGTHTLAASAVDAAGNVAATAELTVMVNNVPDVEPPVISIITPGNGTNIKSTVSVQVSATDNVKVNKVELYVDGKMTASSSTSPFSLKWNAKNAAKGSHQLQCKAYDSAQNSADSSAVTVYK